MSRQTLRRLGVSGEVVVALPRGHSTRQRAAARLGDAIGRFGPRASWAPDQNPIPPAAGSVAGRTRERLRPVSPVAEEEPPRAARQPWWLGSTAPGHPVQRRGHARQSGRAHDRGVDQFFLKADCGRRHGHDRYARRGRDRRAGARPRCLANARQAKPEKKNDRQNHAGRRAHAFEQARDMPAERAHAWLRSARPIKCHRYVIRAVRLTPAGRRGAR